MGRRRRLPYLSAIADHVVERETDDAAEGLGVEQDDRGRDPDLERQARVRQDAAETADPLMQLAALDPSERYMALSSSRGDGEQITAASTGVPGRGRRRLSTG